MGEALHADHDKWAIIVVHSPFTESVLCAESPKNRGTTFEESWGMCPPFILEVFKILGKSIFLVKSYN